MLFVAMTAVREVLGNFLTVGDRLSGVWRTLGILVVIVLVVTGCTNSEPAAAAVLDTDGLFVSSGNPGTIANAAGCGSDEAVAIYLETVAVRREAFKENLEAADPEVQIEVRIAFSSNMPWAEIAPAGDSAVEVTGVGIVLPELLNSDPLEARLSDNGDSPIDGKFL